MNNERYIYKMHDNPGITIILETPPVQGESEDIRNETADQIISDIVSDDQAWYLDDVEEAK